MQRAEMEELRHREANNTALQAIGPRKKLKLDPEAAATTVRMFFLLQTFLSSMKLFLDDDDWKSNSIRDKSISSSKTTH